MLLEQSPTCFDAVDFVLMQNTKGLNFSHYFSGLFAGSNIAFIIGYRLENYEIFAGEEASYRNSTAFGLSPFTIVMLLKKPQGKILFAYALEGGAAGKSLYHFRVADKPVLPVI